MTPIPECIEVRGTTFGVVRYYGVCSEHPRWRPGMRYSKAEAMGDAESHAHWQHDGIDRAGMPDSLVRCLERISDVGLRRSIAAAARGWAEPKPMAPKCESTLDVIGEYADGHLTLEELLERLGPEPRRPAGRPAPSFNERHVGAESLVRARRRTTDR